MTKDEKQIIKLEKVDDKTAYENLLIKYAELEKQDIRLNKLCFDYQEREKRITELENKIADIKANCDLAIEGRDIKIKELEQKLEQTEKDLADYQFNYPTIKELEQQIEKMKCCGNCRFNYCERSSECIDKDGNRIFHCWNEEKEKYCDVGKNGKYQCWEYEGFLAGLKAGRPQWHNINDKEPSKEQFGKQLLIRMKSVIGDTDYDYLVYKYAGESIIDVPDVIAWCEIPTFDKE